MNTINCQVEVFWDHQAEVWVVESTNILGLATEAESLEFLTAKLRKMIPELLLLNQTIPLDYKGNIAIELISRREELIEVA